VIKSVRTLVTAVRALRRNLMRAALTTLGIMIGVGAVIAMMEIGTGSSNAIQKTVASMGANNVMVFPGNFSTRGVSSGTGGRVTLTPQDAEAVEKECTALKAVAPIVSSRTQLVFGRKNWSPNEIRGTTPAFLEVRELKVVEGEPFEDRDVRSGNRVCLLGPTVVRELFDGRSPIGMEVRINNVAFKVIGVLGAKGANMMGQDQDDVVIAPWTAIKARVAGGPMGRANQSASSGGSGSGGGSGGGANSLSQVYPGGSLALYPAQSSMQAANSPMLVRQTSIDQISAAAISAGDIPLAMTQITELLRERHKIREGQPDDFTVRSLTEFTTALTGTTTLMTNLLLCVALISLVVGGVGIMNIMLVSVTERTREIGLRMAVGARGADILRQFLAEAVVLSLIGGAIGILLGVGASWLVRTILKWPTASSPGAIVAAVAVSATVGIVFGYYPAWKASKLDPIEALRYE
jgi:ABC-type antimicrobial peptide transport system permease subunit